MATAKAKMKVDYAVQAKAALKAVERLTNDIDNVGNKQVMCREKWRDYGAALLAQRIQESNNQTFSKWVQLNKLDTGLAKHRSIRADAMWLAEQWDVVTQCYNGTGHNPRSIRRACRKAGYEWAFESDHQKQRKTKSKRYAYTEVVVDELGIERQGGFWPTTSNSRKTTILNELVDIAGTAEIKKKSNEPELRLACQKWIAQHDPDQVPEVVTEQREQVNESARARYDKAIAKATASLEGMYRKKHADLQESFDTEVWKEVEKRLLDERERLNQAIERNRKERQKLKIQREGIAQAMTKKEWQLVLGCLHPDKPQRASEKLGKAFDIIKRLKPYIDAFV